VKDALELIQGHTRDRDAKAFADVIPAFQDLLYGVCQRTQPAIATKTILISFLAMNAAGAAALASVTAVGEARLVAGGKASAAFPGTALVGGAALNTLQAAPATGIVLAAGHMTLRPPRRRSKSLAVKPRRSPPRQRREMAYSRRPTSPRGRSRMFVHSAGSGRACQNRCARRPGENDCARLRERVSYRLEALFRTGKGLVGSPSGPSLTDSVSMWERPKGLGCERPSKGLL